MKNKIRLKFKELFGTNPSMYRSPARINIIGEHTDYNGGFVLPTAISKELYFDVAPNNSNTFRFYAFDLQDYVEISAENIKIQTSHTWTNYLLGILAQLLKKGKAIQGVDLVIGGTIPLGAGLSSSAAMECGFIYALNDLFSYGLSTIEMVSASQMAEHEFAGVKCGIMDQFAVMFSQQNSVIKLDCRSLEYSFMPLQLDDYNIILCDSGVKHTLASTEYNLRRQECERGVEIVSKFFPNISLLRDVSIEQLQACKHQMEEITYNRCSYVIEENIRLEKTCEALQKNDLETFGRMIYDSHYGLKDKYEVSCPELDILVAIAEKSEGVLGARMMGGGFGGCTLNIVHKSKTDAFIAKVTQEYYKTYNKPENIILAELAGGTSKILIGD